jgi:hypothetical protein
MVALEYETRIRRRAVMSARKQSRNSFEARPHSLNLYVLTLTTKITLDWQTCSKEELPDIFKKMGVVVLTEVRHLSEL